MFTFDGPTLAILMIAYGFAASALPVWLLLAPRDYISTMVKLGVAALLAIGVLWVRPDLQMPALTQFTNGTGPIFAGTVFPFVFITIGCGAISGFHALISSGITPKIIAKETHALPLAYGAMLIEGVVAILALIAATAMNPGVYFAVNAPAGIVGAAPDAAAATISSWGYAVSAAEMNQMASDVGEKTLFARTGGAPSLALGMAHIFATGLASSGAAKSILGFWYHFAIMFEALFILTVIDAGTRVGRFMLQDLLGHVWKPIGRTGWMPGVLATSAIVVLAWGYFLYQGVLDPLGGVNTLWPLFGIANQLLATIGFCVATTVILKMHGPKYMWVTVTPMVFLLSVCFTAGLQKIFSDYPRLGFLARAAQLEGMIAEGKVAPEQLAQTQRLIFNERLDAVVCGLFLLMVATIMIDSVRLWASIILGKRERKVVEAPFVLSKLKPGEV
jgi:carbon starvation protein